MKGTKENLSKSLRWMMLYQNLNSDEKYPNFADTIFSRKQFIGKYCYVACYTYGYPRDGITIKQQEDTLTEEEEKIVNGNAVLISISDHTMPYKARLNLCRAEAIAAKRLVNPSKSTN
jgi:hypothetical protein